MESLITREKNAPSRHFMLSRKSSKIRNVLHFVQLLPKEAPMEMPKYLRLMPMLLVAL